MLCDSSFSTCIAITIFSNACVCSEPEGCIEGSVRLSSGDIEQEGIPEVCVNGVWGSICDDGWSSIDGQVFCKQLGYDDIGIISLKVIHYYTKSESDYVISSLVCHSLFLKFQ